MKIMLTTEMNERECRKLIEKAQAKDKKEAEIIIKILEGKSGELGIIRRKVGGAILSKLVSVMGKDKTTYLMEEFKIRAKNGTESFVSWSGNVLIIEVPDEVIEGARIRGNEEKGKKELLKRFKSSKLIYLDGVKNESESETA